MNKTNLLLFHGSLMGALPDGKTAHCPFRLENVSDANVAFALLGHYHRPALIPEASPIMGYPGSTEPLAFGEGDAHGYFVVDVEDGHVQASFEEAASRRYADKEFAIDDIANLSHLEEEIRAWAAGADVSKAIVRLTLSGSPHPDLDLDLETVRERLAPCFGALEIVDRTTELVEAEKLAKEPTSKGRFVRALLDLKASDPANARKYVTALRYGIRAIEKQPISLP